jgi:hypothetical protein
MNVTRDTLAFSLSVSMGVAFRPLSCCLSFSWTYAVRLLCIDSLSLDHHDVPSLAFAWMAPLPGHAQSHPSPMLARGWGPHVQFLEVLFQGRHHQHGKHGWPTFSEMTQFHVTPHAMADVVALQWIGVCHDMHISLDR